MSTREKTASSIFWTSFRDVFQRLMTFVVFLILARLLEPEDFGLVALASAFIVFVELFIRVGFAEAIVQRDELEAGHMDTAFWLIFGIGVVLTLVSVALAGVVSRHFDYPELASVLRWLSLTIVLISLTRIQEAILRRQFQFRALAIRTLIAGFCGGAVGVVMAFSGMGVWSLVAQQLVEASVGLVVLWGSSHWRPGLKVSNTYFRDLYGFGINMVGVQFMHFLDQQANRLIIGYVLGATSLGYYTIAQRLIVIVQQVIGKNVVAVLFPAFSRIQGNTEKLKSVFLNSSRLIALLQYPIFMFLAIAGPEVVQVVFGEKWAPSSGVIQFLSLAALFQSIIVFHHPLFKAVGKPEYALRVSVIKSVLATFLVLIFVHYGIEAASVSVMFASMLVVPVSFYLVDRIFKLDKVRFVKEMRAPIVGSFVLLALVVLLQPSFSTLLGDFFGLVFTTMTGFVVCAFSMWLVDRDLVLEARDAFLAVAMRGKNRKAGIG
ncbi:MAG: lipopolysaccharide biosynthesis protein [Pseudomonadales bacterium]|nr:lipopolysaccharide biosynthesis protein [Pseudomonadales bacterium]